MRRYLNTLGRWLALQSGSRDLPWTFGVLAHVLKKHHLGAEQKSASLDPYGVPAVLQTLQAQNVNGSNFALLFDAHPPASARIETFAASPPFAGKPLDARLAE